MVAFCLNKIYEGRYRRSTYGYLIFNPRAGPYLRINQMSTNNPSLSETKDIPSIRNHLPVAFLKEKNPTKDSKIEVKPLKGLPPTKSKHRFFRYFSNEQYREPTTSRFRRTRLYGRPMQVDRRRRLPRPHPKSRPSGRLSRSRTQESDHLSGRRQSRASQASSPKPERPERGANSHRTRQGRRRSLGRFGFLLTLIFTIPCAT